VCLTMMVKQSLLPSGPASGSALVQATCQDSWQVTGSLGCSFRQHAPTCNKCSTLTAVRHLQYRFSLLATL
jgi:hypothetical protein